MTKKFIYKDKQGREQPEVEGDDRNMQLRSREGAEASLSAVTGLVTVTSVAG